MKIKKVLRYYSDCGRGFWSKQKAIIHDVNCTCWKNPKFKSCMSCRHKKFVQDSNGMEHEPQFLHVFTTNMCKNADNSIPVHKDFEHIRKNCYYWENK